MSLILGTSFDRSYSIRVPFLDGFYNISTFFNKKSSFLLFNVDPDHIKDQKSIKINMFKNLRTSKFCETFIGLHDFKKTNLDIVNQYDSIKDEYKSEINLFINETINLSKVDVEGKTFFDVLTIYGFTMNTYSNEFIYLIAERQNIVRKLSKKVVRTTGISIATTSPLLLIDEYHKEFKNSMNKNTEIITKESIKIV